MLKYKPRQLDEGIHDPSIFKAVFLAGGAGSGKDWILKRIIAGNNLKELNADHAFEMLMKQNDISLDMTKPNKKRDYLRNKAVNTAISQENLAFNGRLGVVINGTGANPHLIMSMKRYLERIGYSTMMVFVDTTNEVSKQRNIDRGVRGGRSVPEHIRSQKWYEAQHNIEYYRKAFGYNFIEVDNSVDSSAMTKEHHSVLDS